MLRLLLRRLAAAGPTLLSVVLLSFLLMKLAPGGPFDGERVLDPATEAALSKAYGLDRPLAEQLGLYLWRLAHGDFGPSLVYRDFSVTELVSEGLPVSLTLGALALLVAVAIGVPFGAAAGWRPDGAIDRVARWFALLANAVPTFVSAPILVLVFGLTLGWLPVSGLGGAANLVLPVIALALPTAGIVTRLTREGVTGVLAADYIRTARAKGLSAAVIVRRHALKPALIPVVSYLGPAAAGLLTGAIVIETVFALPGLGRYFVQGALNRDYPLVLAVVVLYAALIIVFNLIADLLYGWLDPRIRDR